MDFLKTRAPFWKKQHRRDGGRGDWVAATHEDETAAAQWIRAISGRSIHPGDRAGCKKYARFFAHIPLSLIKINRAVEYRRRSLDRESHETFP